MPSLVHTGTDTSVDTWSLPDQQIIPSTVSEGQDTQPAQALMPQLQCCDLIITAQAAVCCLESHNLAQLPGPIPSCHQTVHSIWPRHYGCAVCEQFDSLRGFHSQFLEQIPDVVVPYSSPAFVFQ